MTFALISSSAVMAVAVGAARSGDPKKAVRFLTMTIVGGTIFLGCQAFEWHHFISEGATLTHNPFGVAQFAASYKSRFGNQPYRIATLGYDGVLLTLRVARDWRPGALFPTRRLADRGGFLGLDGAFRFSADNVAERSWEVREVGTGTVSPAPARFAD